MPFKAFGVVLVVVGALGGGCTPAQVREDDEVRKVSCVEADEHIPEHRAEVVAELVDQVVPRPPPDTTQTSRTSRCTANSDPCPRRHTISALAQVSVGYQSKLAAPAVVAFYRRTLPEAGWTVAGPPVSSSPERKLFRTGCFGRIVDGIPLTLSTVVRQEGSISTYYLNVHGIRYSPGTRGVDQVHPCGPTGLPTRTPRRTPASTPAPSPS